VLARDARGCCRWVGGPYAAARRRNSRPAADDSGAPVADPPRMATTVPRTRTAAPSVDLARPLLGGILLVAAALRFAGLGSMPPNSYYDAAVRSMGMSWHAFLVGAFDPNASVSVDKPPVDLWLQVASTKLFGFTPFALYLPEALASTVAVVVLYDLVRRVFGQGAGLTAAAALAVLPAAVMTGRSDTMDSVMMALLVAAAWLVARAVETDRPRPLYAAAVVVGLAFETKLFEALVPLPALVLLFLVGARIPWRRRIAQLLVAGAVMVVVALAWPAAFAALPAGDRPYPMGSTNGSIWDTVFVYNGVGRVGDAALRTAADASAPPGPLRLLSPGRDLGALVGVPLVAALGFGVVALALYAASRQAVQRVQLALTIALAAWLVIGVAVMSAMAHLPVRYLEAVDPAIAGVLGIGLAFTVRRAFAGVRRGWRGVAAATVVAAVLAVPTARSIGVVTTRSSDGGNDGAMPAAELSALSSYLTRHRAGARYEVAAIEASDAGALIARDGQPVLVLAATPYRQLVSTQALAAAVRRGDVRYVLDWPPAPSQGRGGRDRLVAWVQAHASDVSRQAGVGSAGVLYRIDSQTLATG
jgi:4-amino-4-deoxy-L-arabinose transferase-like glycosyltransferase